MSSRTTGFSILGALAMSACILQERPPAATHIEPPAMAPAASPATLSADSPSMAPATSPAPTEAIVSAPFTGDKFAWPPGKTAGISLTYDDSLRSQLDVAVPALDRHHLVGTFFLTEDARSATDRWRALLGRGHELAAHTMLHPCDGAQSWVKKDRALQDYNAGRMTAELKESIGLLKSLGNVRGPYTFAYPCGSTWIGATRESYIPLVKPLFSAARGIGPGSIDPATETFENAPAISADKSAEELIALVEDTAKNGRALVFMFHGVGSENLMVTTEAHEKLLFYLESHRQTIWTATFGALSTYVQTHRPPLAAAPVR